MKTSTHNRCSIDKYVLKQRRFSSQDKSFRAVDTDLLFLYGPLQLVQFEERGFLVQLYQQRAVIWQRSIPQKLQNMSAQEVVRLGRIMNPIGETFREEDIPPISATGVWTRRAPKSPPP